MFSVFKEAVLLLETEMNSANISTPSLKGLLNLKKQRCFKKSRTWSCLGATSLFIQCRQWAVGCTPLHKQSRCCAVGGSQLRDRGWQLWCSPTFCLDRGQGSLHLRPRAPPTPPQQSWSQRGRRESVPCFWRHLRRAPALTCSTPFAVLHLPATALLPQAGLLPWKPSPGSRGARLPCIANIFRNDPVAAMHYEWNKRTII